MDPAEDQISGVAEPPHSIAQAKIDDKGRLKLPAESWDWCKKSNVVSVFVTTFDKKSVRIYPTSEWKSTVKVMEAAGPHAKAMGGVLKMARSYGRDAEIDAQGRIVIPGVLRDKLELGPEPVCLEHLKGRMDFTKKSMHDVLLAEAEADLDAKNEIALELGL